MERPSPEQSDHADTGASSTCSSRAQSVIARYKSFLAWTGASFLVIIVLGEGYFRIWKAPEKVGLIS